MRNIKLIALDLDGTLLTSDKKLTERTFQALQRAHEAGVHIVPSTGRYYLGMPKIIRDIPFVRYVITVNGAALADLKEERILDETLIPNEEAIEILRYFDTLPAAYDCYKEKGSYMTKSMFDNIDDYLTIDYFLKMVKELRTPVPELKEWLRVRGGGVQKLMLLTRNQECRAHELATLADRFPDICVTSSISENVEVNHRDANKGTGLRKLAHHLGIDISETMAFGDGLNDLSMIDEAGIGVVMDNAAPEIKSHADILAPGNDDDGVARVIESLVL